MEAMRQQPKARNAIVGHAHNSHELDQKAQPQAQENQPGMRAGCNRECNAPPPHPFLA
jgi:hypothetical protein